MCSKNKFRKACLTELTERGGWVPQPVPETTAEGDIALIRAKVTWPFVALSFSQHFKGTISTSRDG